MGVVRAQIQTVEEIYQLVWTAVANKKPIEAIYQGGLDRFVCTGLAVTGKDSFVCSAINTAAKAGAGSSRRVRRQTGAAWRWKSSVG